MLSDAENQDLSECLPLAASFISRAESVGGRVFVHCILGEWARVFVHRISGEWARVFVHCISGEFASQRVGHAGMRDVYLRELNLW